MSDRSYRDASGINDVDKESFRVRNRLHNVENGKRLDNSRSHSDGEEPAETGMKKQLAEMRRALNNVRQEMSKHKMDCHSYTELPIVDGYERKINSGFVSTNTHDDRSIPAYQTRVIMLLKECDQRSNFDEFGIGVVHLWSQRQSLVIVKGILHRNFVRADGSLLYQQALVPRSIQAVFLHWVHDDPSSGYFGILNTGKTTEVCLLVGMEERR